jgi:hypothetical protein
MYRTQKGLTEIIPLLADQSKERLENNAEFQTYLDRRDRLEERYNTKTISLSLSNRMAEAEAEKELDDIQTGAFLMEEEQDDEREDVILSEAIHILSDLIDLQNIGQSEELLAPNLSSN